MRLKLTNRKVIFQNFSGVIKYPRTPASGGGKGRGGQDRRGGKSRAAAVGVLSGQLTSAVDLTYE